MKTFHEKLVPLFSGLYATPLSHARFINTLSYLEYIGARKIFKSQSSGTFTFELLKHAAEEIRHAQILKGLALKMSQDSLTSFQSHHLFSGMAASTYIQNVDKTVEKYLELSPVNFLKNKSDLQSTTKWFNYLFTTWAIEQRASALYPHYQAFLIERGLGDAARAIQSILRDEKTHLQDVLTHLHDEPSSTEELFERITAVEQTCFEEFLTACLIEMNSAQIKSNEFNDNMTSHPLS